MSKIATIFDVLRERARNDASDGPSGASMMTRALNAYEWLGDVRDAFLAEVTPEADALASGETGEVPLGAIENGRAFADRVEQTGFQCDAGELWMNHEWQEFRRCFEHLVEWAHAALQTAPVAQDRGEAEAGDFSDYDAGLLSDYGGGNVEWWQNYLRAELCRANEFWREQVAGRSPLLVAPLPTPTQPAPSVSELVVAQLAELSDRFSDDVLFWKTTSTVESHARIEAEDRLARVLRICRKIKWIGIGMPATVDGETQQALVELCEVLFADGVATALIRTPGLPPTKGVDDVA